MNLPKFAVNYQPIVLCAAALLIAYGVYTWNTAPRFSITGATTSRPRGLAFASRSPNRSFRSFGNFRNTHPTGMRWYDW